MIDIRVGKGDVFFDIIFIFIGERIVIIESYFVNGGCVVVIYIIKVKIFVIDDFIIISNFLFYSIKAFIRGLVVKICVC